MCAVYLFICSFTYYHFPFYPLSTYFIPIAKLSVSSFVWLSTNTQPVSHEVTFATYLPGIVLDKTVVMFCLCLIVKTALPLVDILQFVNYNYVQKRCFSTKIYFLLYLWITLFSDIRSMPKLTIPLKSSPMTKPRRAEEHYPKMILIEQSNGSRARTHPCTHAVLFFKGKRRLI